MNPIIRDIDKIYASDGKLKREDVRILQEWIKKQPHLPHVTEVYVILFLHSCYYNIEQAKATIDIFFTKRTHYIHIFERLPEEDLRSTLSYTLVDVLPKKTSQGYAILYVKLIDQRAENFFLAKIIRMIEMVGMLYLYGQGPVNGALLVLDAEGFSLGHLARFNLVIVKHALHYLQEGAPVRIKGIHILNAASVVDKTLALLKPLIKSELFNMINVHSTFDTFYKYVPKECLPEDFGGEVPSCQNLQEENLKHLLNNSDFFAWNDSLRVDESQRLDKSDSFGIEGTFKKLEID